MNILEVISEGGTILYPTDTVWGIGGDATNPEVIKKIDQIKNREKGKSYLILVNDYKMLNNYVKKIPIEIWELLEKAIRPTTIIFPNPKNLPKELLAKDGSIAIRVIKKGFAHDLIKNVGKPLISTSANKAGSPTPIKFDDIEQTILQNVDYVVNLHRNTSSTEKPSRIIKWSEENGVEIIRD
jgi:L-threonylcarbamoyladenylate synthase